MNKHTSHPFLLAACSVPVDGTVQRIQLIPAGEFRANDGRPVDAPFWRLNPQRAAVLVAELNARPVRLMVDYEHQTLFTAQNGQPNPASGWLSGFEWIDGKRLYAEVQWTAAAKQRIAGGEYRYISPVFQYTASGDILSLLPPALTNTPALDQLDPVALAAASRLLNTLQPSQKDEAMNEAQKLMLSLLGLPETASEAEQLAAMQQIQSSTDGKKLAEALAAAKEAAKPENKPAEPNPTAAPAAPAGQPANDEPGAPNTAAASQQVPLSALQGLQQQVAALSQQLAAHEAEKTAQLITAALSDGRLLPAQKAWAEGLGKTNPQALADFLATAQPLAALSATQTGGIPPAAAEKGLTADEAKVAEMLGITAEDYAKEKQE